MRCLRQLGEGAGFDALVEGAIKSHESDWHLLVAAAQELTLAQPTMERSSAAEFKRGEQSGRMVDSSAHGIARERSN